MGNKNEKASFLKTDLYLQIGVCCVRLVMDGYNIMGNTVMSMKYFDD